MSATARNVSTQSLPPNIATRIAIEPADSCWIWTGSRNGHGYGIAFLPSGLRTGAHRRVYELLVGPIPAGLELDHLCRVTSCVNPAHLEPVTHRVNVLRGATGARTHCVHGHPLFGPNLRVDSRGRLCRTCCRERGRRFRERRAAVTA